jgi:hypothetical protein
MVVHDLQNPYLSYLIPINPSVRFPWQGIAGRFEYQAIRSPKVDCKLSSPITRQRVTPPWNVLHICQRRRCQKRSQPHLDFPAVAGPPLLALSITATGFLQLPIGKKDVDLPCSEVLLLTG